MEFNFRKQNINTNLGWYGEKIKDMNKCEQTIKKLKKNGYKILCNIESNYSFIKE